MPPQTLLIVDEDNLIRGSIKTFLENHDYKICEAKTIVEAVKHDFSAYSAIVCDEEHIELVKLASNLPVIVISAQASLRSAVIAMKLGAADYLAKPFDYDELRSTIHNLTHHRDSHQQLQILGACAAVKSLKDKIERVAPTDTNVLIEGESGTGKELVALNIHALSRRADRQIVSLNCAGIYGDQKEFELFGRESSLFNNKTGGKSGLIEAADGSTLFLNEIGDLSAEAQARLLRIMEESEPRPIGNIEPRKVSIRLIASTHKNLQALVAAGTFREDLYFRLNVIKFILPPLREREEDTLLLAKHFLKTNAIKHGKKKLKFGDAALNALINHGWPGNVRELKNAIERAVILCEKKTITSDLLALETKAKKNTKSVKSNKSAFSLENYFVKFVIENQDRMTETEIAQTLGISRKALWQRRQRLGLPRERNKNPGNQQNM